MRTVLSGCTACGRNVMVHDYVPFKDFLYVGNVFIAA